MSALADPLKEADPVASPLTLNVRAVARVVAVSALPVKAPVKPVELTEVNPLTVEGRPTVNLLVAVLYATSVSPEVPSIFRVSPTARTSELEPSLKVRRLPLARVDVIDRLPDPSKLPEPVTAPARAIVRAVAKAVAVEALPVTSVVMFEGRPTV
jgi:hypothetical protein